MTDNEPLMTEMYAIRHAIERMMDRMDEIRVQVDAWGYEQRLARIESELERIKRHIRLDD